MQLILTHDNKQVGTRETHIFNVGELLSITCSVKGLHLSILECSELSDGTPTQVNIDMGIKEALEHSERILDEYCTSRKLYHIKVEEEK